MNRADHPLRHVFTPKSFYVRCNGVRHEIQLTKNGALLLLDHVESRAGDDVMKSLTGKLCRCDAVDATWRHALRDHVIRASTVSTLPRPLLEEVDDIIDLRYRRKENNKSSLLYAKLNASVFTGRFSAIKKATNHELNHFRHRLRLACHRIAEEAGAKTTYKMPPSHRFGRGIYITATQPLSAGKRPTIVNNDSVIGGARGSDILGLKRDLRFNCELKLFIRTYLKTKCLVQSGDDVLALCALLEPWKKSKALRKAIVGRQHDDLTIWTHKAVVAPSEPLWHIVRWLD